MVLNLCGKVALITRGSGPRGEEVRCLRACLHAARSGECGGLPGIRLRKFRA